MMKLALSKPVPRSTVSPDWMVWPLPSTVSLPSSGKAAVGTMTSSICRQHKRLVHGDRGRVCRVAVANRGVELGSASGLGAQPDLGGGVERSALNKSSGTDDLTKNCAVSLQRSLRRRKAGVRIERLEGLIWSMKC